VKNRTTIPAKDLRKRSTDAERNLWNKLRAKQIQGLKFRRQEPIGRYIVDFVCYERQVIIEVDGGQHAAAIAEDSARDTWLSSQGFKVMRFWDHEVLTNIQGVLGSILEALSPSPNLSHQGRGKIDNPLIRNGNR
jgi:very-short-patch-repair endonuclease